MPVKYWTFAIAGWSGFSVMLVELLGGRLMSPYFGSSVYVWGSVIFVFMLALSIGYLLGGKFSRHAPSVARLGMLLIASSLLVLPTALFGDAVMGAIFDWDIDPRYGSLLACLTLFGATTLVAGMISPYAVRILAGDRQSVGNVAGNLYFVSTLGSSAGTLLTAFYFVLWFEVNTILLAAIAVSVTLGSACLVLTRGHAKGE